MGTIRAAWIGVFATALLASTAAWALPSVSTAETAVTARPEPLWLIRHHHRHGHWRHHRSREPEDDAPDAAIGGADDAPAALALPPDTAPTVPSRTSRGSGSSGPAIRWVDPEKSPR